MLQGIYLMVCFLTTEDMQKYVELTTLSIKELAKSLPEAMDMLNSRKLDMQLNDLIAAL